MATEGSLESGEGGGMGIRSETEDGRFCDNGSRVESNPSYHIGRRRGSNATR